MEGDLNKMEEKEFLLTQEGYDNLEKTLEDLKTNKRNEIAERIKVALGFGDSAANSSFPNLLLEGYRHMALYAG